MAPIYFILISALIGFTRSEHFNKVLPLSNIFTPAYERLTYFSKMSALTNCISYGQLYEDKTLLEGGCPPHLQFCSDLNIIPFADQEYIKKVLLPRGSSALGTGFIAIDKHHQVINVASRGSSTRWDWLHDFLVAPTNYIPFSVDKYEEQVELGNIPSCDDCKLHSGFSVFLRTLQESFMDTLEETYNEFPDYNLVISGHSLGAAVAVLCGIEVKIRGYNPTVVTYAQPKIFNSKMSDWVDNMFQSYNLDKENRENNAVNLKSGYYRLVHINDYVTDLPPLYSHSGLQININKIMAPHKIEDLSYVGLDYTNPKNVKVASKIISVEEPTGVKSLLMTDLLHLYEHRHYFVQINECDYL